MQLPYSIKCFNMATKVTWKATPQAVALADLLCFCCSGVVVEAVPKQVPKSVEAQ